MTSILATLLPIFGIMAIGAFAERRQMLPAGTATTLNQFVYWFSLPLLLFHQMALTRPADIPPAGAAGFVLGLLCTYALLFMVQKLRKDTGKACHMVGLVSAFPNAAFMGMPIIFLLMPNNAPAAAAAGLAVVLTSIPMLFADTVLGLQSSAGGGRAVSNVFRALTHNPIMVCTALGAVVGLSGFTLPDPLMTTARMLGSTAAPCALFCMGMTLAAQISAKSGQSWGQWQRQVGMSFGKLALAPLLVFAVSYALGERGAALASITIMASMPTAVVAYIIAQKHKAAAEDCSTAIVSNTLLSALTIPLVIVLLRAVKVLPN